MPKEFEYVRYKNVQRKLKSPFMIKVNFESILVPEDEKQNPDESFANKYQKHVTCSYGYRLLYVDDTFSEPFKSYLDENVIYYFINSMIEKSKYCSNVMEKYFNKELVMNKEDKKDFKNSTKQWIWDNYYVDNDVKVRDQCHITGKCGSAHGYCNINIKLNHKIPIVFHNLKSYDCYLIMQELGKFNFEVNIVLNGLEKYTSSTINNKLNLIDSFQFLNSSLDSLVKNLAKDGFKYLNQEFDNKVLDLLKQK